MTDGVAQPAPSPAQDSAPLSARERQALAGGDIAAGRWVDGVARLDELGALDTAPAEASANPASRS